MSLAKKNPVDWLQRNLSVSFPGHAEVMQVSLSGDDPKEVTILVNAVVDTYLNEIVSAERAEKRSRLSDLEKACAEKETQIRATRRDQEPCGKRR